MKDVHPLWGLLIFLVFVIVNNVLYGFKTAIKNVSDDDFDDVTGAKKEGILNMIAKPTAFGRTLQVITAIFDIVMGSCLLSWFALAVYDMNIVSSKLGTILLVAVAMFVFMQVFGIVVPSSLALRKPVRYVNRYYYFVKCFEILFCPVTFVVNVFAKLVLLPMGQDINNDIDNVTEEEIIDMVNEGHEQGVLLESEAQMINNIFEFGDKNAADVMIHRKNIIALDGNTTLEKSVKLFIEEGLSRVPIYEEDIDNIIGVLHFKDAFKQYESVEKRKLTILAFKDMLYDAHFIPETKDINQLFKEMKSDKVHMAIVIDEYGQTVGLVTMEDIIEEIVGNILDEHDEDEHNIRKQAENVYVVDGLTELDELKNLLDIEFDETDFETLNGFLISKLERIPDEGEKNIEIDYKNYKFKVLRVEKNMISKVRIVRDDKNSQTA